MSGLPGSSKIQHSTLTGLSPFSSSPLRCHACTFAVQQYCEGHRSLFDRSQRARCVRTEAQHVRLIATCHRTEDRIYEAADTLALAVNCKFRFSALSEISDN